MWRLGIISLVFGVMAAVVYGLSRLLRSKPITPSISSPRRSSLVAIVLLVAILAAAIVGLLIYSWVTGTPISQSSVREKLESPLAWIALATIPVYILPVVIITMRRKESLESIGITTKNLWQSIVIGVILSAAIILLSNPKNIQKLPLIGMSHVIALFFYAVVGFGEEFLFRGYLQNRLVAWLGTWGGLLLTAAIFVMFHIPQTLMLGSDWERVLMKTANYVPIALFLGFVMLRTGNLMTIGLFHTFANWVSVLKDIS